MDYSQRTQAIGSWLQRLLKRYTPPSSMDQGALSEELQLIVTDINSYIPSQFEAKDMEVVLTKVDANVRAYQASRSWPTIKTFIESTKKAVDDYSRNTNSEVPSITLDKSDNILVKQIKKGLPIPDWILNPDSPQRQKLLEETDLTLDDLNKYLDPAARVQ
jgi:hypothetical protein|tara:strand:- start:9 stop:491 length:483 start_codon:yes stop_codon:yes gene_type:complete